MRASLMIAILIGITCLLFGCAAVSVFTSEPTGASVSLNGKPIGTTPFSYAVQDIFGMNSSYDFRADKAGYRPDAKTFREKGFEGAKEAIPPRIHFVLIPVREQGPTNKDESKQRTDGTVLPLIQPPKSVEPF